MRRPRFLVTGVSLALLLGGAALAAAAEKGEGKSLDRAGIERLKERAAGRVRVTLSEATGGVRFAGIEPGEAGDLMPSSAAKASEKARAFLRENAGVFGLLDADAELQVGADRSDSLGTRHVSFYQSYRGVPVFAGVMTAHFGKGGELTAVSGNLIPDVSLNTNPSRTAVEAGAAAIAAVGGDNPGRAVFAQSGLLMIYREGLARGIEGPNHLAYQIEVGNGSDIREFVYVDAHSGKVIERLPGIFDAMYRRAYDGLFLPAPPPSYPGSPFWVEGQAFPTGVAEADNMITSSKETYDFYKNAFGRDSFDGAGAIMDSIFNRGYSCPNASWNGTFISFCNGLTTDDVTGHEWSHAYTQYTDGLIYAWQSGALNESYSDIFGETIDRINGRDVVGNSATDPLRLGVVCTTYTPLSPKVTVNSPAAIAGDKPSGTAAFGPQAFAITNDVVLANDGAGVATDGCTVGVNSWTNAAQIAGKIALVDRGTCSFVVKAKNAQDNGAVGLIVANNTTGIVNMAGADPTVVIPSLSILQSDGTAIKTQLLSTTVNVSLSRGQFGTDPSTRWLVGEDDTAVGLTGALRDMYNPPCYNNPGKTSDGLYGCGDADNGGVHNNSGVPNHAYALIVDGGTYNGQTVNGIGLTKAAHIYFRAESVYQHPSTTFAEHADAIEQSAADLLGVNLADLNTGAPSGQMISAADLAEIHKAMLAVEMRTLPTQCNFQPLLGQNPPALCTSGSPSQIFKDSFDSGDAWLDHWVLSHEGTTPDFAERDWTVVGNLPDGRAGRALYGVDSDAGTCGPGGLDRAVLHADTKQISIPASVANPKLTFLHWVSTEPGWDGGNVKISVNGGPWTLIPASAFIYNPYNTSLFTAAQGNTNPIAGQPAFTGADGGTTSGTWSRSIIDLTGIAKAKDKIQLRFDIGNDDCTGWLGWYIDDLLVYKCN